MGGRGRPYAEGRSHLMRGAATTAADRSGRGSERHNRNDGGRARAIPAFLRGVGRARDENFDIMALTREVWGR